MSELHRTGKKMSDIIVRGCNGELLLSIDTII